MLKQLTAVTSKGYQIAKISIEISINQWRSTVFFYQLCAKSAFLSHPLNASLTITLLLSYNRVSLNDTAETEEELYQHLKYYGFITIALFLSIFWDEEAHRSLQECCDVIKFKVSRYLVRK